MVEGACALISVSSDQLSIKSDQMNYSVQKRLDLKIGESAGGKDGEGLVFSLRLACASQLSIADDQPGDQRTREGQHSANQHYSAVALDETLVDSRFDGVSRGWVGGGGNLDRGELDALT